MERYIRWEPDELEALIRKLVADRIEGFKVDYKLEIDTNPPEGRAELVKDLSAVVNTYHDAYYNYGFLIYGAKPGSIIGTKQTNTDSDNLQNTIEQLTREYIAPFFSTYVYSFEEKENSWGVIVIPPSTQRPHVVFKDFQCRDPQKKLFKGDWFVRRGSSTDKAGPEDYARLLHTAVEQAVDPLRTQLRTLQGRYEDLSEKYDSALFNAITKTGLSNISVESDEGGSESTPYVAGSAAGLDLPARFRHRLRGPEDTLSQDLLQATLELQAYLESDELPWSLRSGEPSHDQAIILELESRSLVVVQSIASIIGSDTEGVFDKTIIKAVKTLAKKASPQGSYTELGEAMRSYPLLIVLYTIFVVGVQYNRDPLLRAVLDIPLQDWRSRSTEHVANVGFTLGYTKDFFNRAFAFSRCEPARIRIQAYLDENVFPLFPYEDERAMFFQGEFVLALAGIEARELTPGWTLPLPGLYLYFRDATEILQTFLQRTPNWFTTFYHYPIETVLETFDKTSGQAVMRNCTGEGFTTGALEAYQGQRNS